MSMFLDLEARDTGGNIRARFASDSSGGAQSASGDESDSETIPLQNDPTPSRGARKRPHRCLDSPSDSEAEGQGKESCNKDKVASKPPKKKKSKKNKKKPSTESEEGTFALLRELKQNNSILSDLVEQMRSHDTRLSAIETRLDESQTSITPKRTKQRKEVPCEARVS